MIYFSLIWFLFNVFRTKVKQLEEYQLNKDENLKG